MAGRELDFAEFGVYRLMSIEGVTRGSGQPAGWVDLVAGIRAGDEQAVFWLEDIFQSGICYFLSRALGQHQLESRQREVLALVIKSIKENSIREPSRLVSYVLTVLRQYIRSQMTVSLHLVPEEESHANVPAGAIRTLLANIAAVDREALHRYYAGGETGEQICRALNITSARFRAVRNTTRAAVMSRPKESKRRLGLSK
jgi:hypothetical protein